SRILTAPGRVQLQVEGRAEPIVLDLPPGDTAVRMKIVRGVQAYLPPVVADVQPGGPGARAGLTRGDRVLRGNTDTVASWGDCSRMIRAHPAQRVTVTLARGDSVLTLAMVPDRKVDTDPETKEEKVYGMVGVLVRLPALPEVGPVEAVRMGWRETAFRT